MLVIWNPHAGSVNRARQLYERLAMDPGVEICSTQTSDEAVQLVADRIAAGERHVVAAGGDGTVNAVLNGIMARPDGVKLGVLPLGTANDWCASLAIPDDLEQAWHLIEQGAARRIDLVQLKTPDTRIFFANIATGGNSHRVTEAVTDEMKQTWGALCYLRGAIGVVADLDTFHTSISFDGGPAETFDVWNIMVANGKTSAGRIQVAPKAELDDGLLDVVIIRDGTLLDIANIAASYFVSAYIESDQVEYRQARSIAIRSKPPLLFSIDGDLIEQQPLEFVTVPEALDVVVGRTFGNGT